MKLAASACAGLALTITLVAAAPAEAVTLDCVLGTPGGMITHEFYVDTVAGTLTMGPLAQRVTISTDPAQYSFSAVNWTYVQGRKDVGDERFFIGISRDTGILHLSGSFVREGSYINSGVCKPVAPPKM